MTPQEIKANAPYGATNAGIKEGLVDYLIISMDGIILRWSYAESGWYGTHLPYDELWEYYDDVIEVNHDE